MADKYTTATQEAWTSGPWSYGRPVESRAQALVAARWAYLQAGQESGRTAHFNDLAKKAAYAYGITKLTAAQILLVVYNETKGSAPAVAQKVKRIEVRTGAAAPARVSASRSRAPAAAPHVHEEATALDTYLTDPPAWLKWGGVGALGLLALWAFWPRRRAVEGA